MSPARLKRQRTKKRKIFFRKWHRRIGFTVSIFLFNLAITGIILNHYESLSLHKKHIQSVWILDWYGVKQPQKINCVELNSSKLCQIGSYLFQTKNLDDIKPINTQSGQLISLITMESEIYLVSDTRIDIFSINFQLIESLDVMELLGETIQNAVANEHGIIVQTSEQQLLLDLSMLEFESYDRGDFTVDNEQTLHPFDLADTNLIQAIGLAYRQQQISYLKLVQDLHSGQILSIQGKLLTDIVGVIILLLAISGFITWRRRKNENHN